MKLSRSQASIERTRPAEAPARGRIPPPCEAWFFLTSGSTPEGTIVRLPVLSSSMSPQLPKGSIAVIRACGYRDCRPGDMIVFRRARRLLVHRFLVFASWRGEWYVYEKGDQNSFGALLPAARIVGRVVAVGQSDGSHRAIVPGAAGAHQIHLWRDLCNRLLFLPRLAKSSIAEWVRTILP